MAFGRLQRIRSLYGTLKPRDYPTLLGSSRSYNLVQNNDLKYWRLPHFLCEGQNIVTRQDETLEFNCQSFSSSSCNSNHGAVATLGNKSEIPFTMAANSYFIMGGMRSLATQAAAAQTKAPPQARQTGSFKVSMTSPGIIYEPYAPREPIAFWRRCFTRSGWKRTKDDIIIELKSAYAIAKLRKSGYSKQKFYQEALEMYKQINTLIATGDKTLLRKTVTDKLYSIPLTAQANSPFFDLSSHPLVDSRGSNFSLDFHYGPGLKNEIKARETMWSTVYWELVEPVIKIRTLRARLIGVDPKDTNKVFIQLTMEFLAKQKFEAYDSEGKVVAGDKNKEVLVRDIWIFEKSLFLPGSYWRLCGRINL